MKRKVLFVITKSNWGGAQRYVYNLASSLPREEFDVGVALGGTGAAGSAAGQLQTELTAANIPSVVVRSFARDVSLISDVRAFFELLRIYRRERPDVVHLNSSKAGGVGALAARCAGVRNIVFTSHGLPYDEDRTLVAKAAIACVTWLTFLLCHTVITISRDNYERARRLPFCTQKMVLIHNGLPSLTFETRERARVSLAVRVGLAQDGNTFWIGTIAELTRNKNLSVLIKAAQTLKHEGIHFHLFIIGSGEQRTRLAGEITTAKLDDCVHLVGFVADAYRYLKAFNLFALTSIKEGLPYVLLEAGQAEVAVVASNIPGTHDIIEDTRTGILADPRSAENIAYKIVPLMHNPTLRHQLAKNLHEKVVTEFSMERMVEETKKAYRSYPPENSLSIASR